jgi:glycosyltransferase involved in cell wall biosynthesis
MGLVNQDIIDNILISVIIPVYNSELYIENAIMSVLNQSYSNFELIVIDDGSTDSSAYIVEQIKDSRLRFFKKSNEGQCKTSNFGLSKSKGNYIKFLDADDFIDKHHLKMMLDVAIKNDSFGSSNMLYLCKWQRFSSNGFLWPIQNRPEWCDSSPTDFIEKAIGNGPDMLSAWQWLIPKEILQLSGGWNEELGLGNDFEFSIRLILSSNGIRFCNESIVYYRSDLKNNMSSNNDIKTILSVLKASRISINRILSLNNNASLKRVCADKLKIWLITYYPYIEKRLIKEVEEEIYNLGGSCVYPNWGRRLLILSNFFGWKITRLIQHYYYYFRFY